METLLAIWMYLLNTGTNIAIAKFLAGNAILIGAIVWLTPSKKDDKLYRKLRKEAGLEKNETSTKEPD